MNTILLAYRNRPALLRTFLASLAGTSLPVIIVDLGSVGTEDVLKRFPDLHIRHEWFDDSGPFNKSKATNYAIRLAETEFVTIADVDSAFPARFFDDLTNFVATAPNKKIGIRIKYLDPHHSHLVLSDSMSHAEQWFTKETGNYAHEGHAGHLTGNSHLCMRRTRLIELGGLDERYVGYGWEDHDFNMRCVENGIETVMFPTPILHLWHQRENDWYMDKYLNANKALFEQNKSEGFPPIQFGGLLGQDIERSIS